VQTQQAFQKQQVFQPIPVPSAEEVDRIGNTGSAQVLTNGDREQMPMATAAMTMPNGTLHSPPRKERRYHTKPAPLEALAPFTSSVIVELGTDDDIWAWEDEGLADDLEDIDEDRSPTWPTRKPTVRFEKTSPKPLRKDGVIRKTSFADIGHVRFMNRRHQHRST